MANKNFRRKIEDFICNNCGFSVKGNGYTDHCPNCLFGSHVDINPGDRLSQCKGSMLPVHSVYKSGQFTIFYKCKKCGIKKQVKASNHDNTELLIKLSSRIS